MKRTLIMLFVMFILVCTSFAQIRAGAVKTDIVGETLYMLPLAQVKLSERSFEPSKCSAVTDEELEELVEAGFSVWYE